MANKRTYINADEELVIQGKLTIEGEFVQKEFVETVSYSESTFAGDFLVVNSDGFDLTNNPTSATLRLRHGSANADIVWDGVSFVFSEDINVGNIISTGTLTGNLDGTAANATVLETPRAFSITGDGNAPAQSFDGSSNTVLTFTLNTVNSAPGAFGDAATIPVITVDGKGLVTSSSETAVNINSGQVNDFVDAVRSNISLTDAGGDGSLTYNAGTGAFVYTGPSASEVRAHFSATNGIDYNSTTGAFQADTSEIRGFFSHVDTGGDGSFSYNSTSGVFTYTGPSAAEARAHFSASNGVDYNSATGAFQAVESEIQHDALDGFVSNEHIDHSTIDLTAGAGLTGGGDITASRTFDIGQGDGIAVSTDAVAVDNTVVRTTGEQFINGVKHFQSNIIMFADIIPDAGNIYNLGSHAYHFDHVYANVIHAESMDLGDANIHDIHNTFDAGIRTVGIYADNTAEGLRFTHNTTGASYAVSTGDGLEIDGVHVAVDNTVLRTNVDQTITSVTTITGTLDLSSATVPSFTVAGDLTVQGTFNSQNTVDTYVTDQKITLNANATVDNTVEIVANRPDAVSTGGSDTAIRWNENIDKWQFTNDGNTYHDMLTESASQSAISVNNVSGFGNLSYNSGTISYVGTSAQDIRDQFSTVGTGIDYDDTAGEFQANISGIRSYFSATTGGGDGSLTYDPAQGRYTYTGPGLSEAQAHIVASASQVRDHFSAGEAINISGGIISLGNVTSQIAFNEGIIKILNGTIGIGLSAGTHDVAEDNAIAIGNFAGSIDQQGEAIAIGDEAGYNSQYRDSVAIGHRAGHDEQGGSAGAGRSVAVGYQAGEFNQGGQALALGESAGLQNQGQGAVAIGTTAGAVYQGEHSVAIGPSAGKGSGSPFASQPPNSIVIRAGNVSYPALTGTNEGALYISPIRQNSADTSNVLMYNYAEKEVTSVASTIFVHGIDDQTVSGAKTFSGELIIPNSGSTTDGAIYYDSANTKAYIYIGGNRQEITPAINAGDVEAVGTGATDIYAGSRASGNVTVHGIKSITDGTYTTINDSANVITIDGDISAIRGAFSAQDNGGDGSFSYNAGTGAFTYTGPSAAEARAHFSASGLLSYNSTTGAFTTTADNYGNWSLQTDSGAGAQESVTSGEIITIQGGTNISVTNSGGTITIANDNTADITAVNAGAGLTGGGASGSVTLNVVGGDGIIADPDQIKLDNTVVRTSGAQNVAGDKTFTGNVQVESLNIANNYDFPLADGSTNQVLTTDGNGQLAFQDVTTIGGTITGVTAGDGLTGGGIAGSITLNVVGGTGITANANDIALDFSEFDTGNIVEGTKLFYTDARARGAISVTDAGGDGSLSYNSTSGVITYTGPSASQVRAHISVTDAGGDGSLSYNSTSGVITYTGPSAGEVRAHLSGGTGITYNNSTGVIALSDTGYISGVTAGTGLTGGGSAGNVTLNVSGLTVSQLAGGSLQTSAEAFANSDTVLMTAAAIEDKILSYGYTTEVGDITGVSAGTGLTGGGTSGAVSIALATAGAGAGTYGSSALSNKIHSITLDAYGRVTAVGTGATGDIQGVTAGTGLSGGGTSGTVTLNVDLSELPDMTEAVINTQDELVVLDSGVSKRKMFNEIGLTKFDNDGDFVRALTIKAPSSDSGLLVTQGTTLVFAGGAGITSSRNSGIITHEVDLTDTSVFTDTNTANKAVVRDGSGNFSAGIVSALATSARYADLAEKYSSDSEYECGTVVVFGGTKEITVTNQENDHRVAGIISTDPAYMMNSESDGQYVALRGRVPCKVIGPVLKGDVLVTSHRPGFATASNEPHLVSASCMIGKALQDFDGTEGVIEVVV